MYAKKWWQGASGSHHPFLTYSSFILLPLASLTTLPPEPHIVA
jgi:hypothetical protein